MITFAFKERESLKKDNMPEIGRFYGIVIKMFFKPKEHEFSHYHKQDIFRNIKSNN